MHPLGSRDYGTGNVYEMRTYTYASGDIPKVLEGWSKAIEAREKFSPLAACWTSELGGLNKFVHIWVYKDSTSAPASGGIPLARRSVAAAGGGAADPAGKQAADPGGLLPRAVGERLDEQPISVCLGGPGPWVRCLAQAASGAEGVFRGVSTLVFQDKKVLSVGARPRLPPRALGEEKGIFPTG